MPKPFKNLTSPAKNATASPKATTQPSKPTQGSNFATNEERINTLRDGEKPIAWPETDQGTRPDAAPKPMRLKGG